MPAPTVIVRCELPASPERVFDLFTRADQLALWFCDVAESDVQPGGRVRAEWLDEEGEPWQRTGTWAELEPPHFARLEWFEAGVAPQDPASAAEPTRDTWQIGIAPAEGGCRVTVVSPLAVGTTALSGEALADAIRQGWERCFAALADLLEDERRGA